MEKRDDCTKTFYEKILLLLSKLLDLSLIHSLLHTILLRK